MEVGVQLRSRSAGAGVAPWRVSERALVRQRLRALRVLARRAGQRGEPIRRAARAQAAARGRAQPQPTAARARRPPARVAERSLLVTTVPILFLSIKMVS